MGNFGLFAILLLCFLLQGGNCQECSGGPPMQLDFNCCNINYPVQQTECLQRVYEKRDAFRQSANKDASVKTGDLCISKCLFNNTNVIAPDNKVNSDELKVVVEKILGTEWQALLPSIILTCKEHIDNCNSHGHHGPPPGSEGPPICITFMAGCDMRKEKLFSCLREQFLFSCPDSAWKKSGDCNDMRSYIKNCPFERRGPPRLPQLRQQ